MIKHRFKGRDWISLVRDLLSLVFEDDKDFILTIKEYKEKRSLQANNYSWALTDKLSEKMLLGGLRLSKDEMHAEMIYRYGQPLTDEDGFSVIIKALSEIDVTDFYQYANPEGVDLDGYVNWRIYRGSSTYNKQEMSLFIKGIVEECRELGIPTETPDEIARMISLMKEAR